MTPPLDCGEDCARPGELESELVPSEVASPRMRVAYGLCALYAQAKRPVVFVGSVGAGKTRLAYHIHRLSKRPGKFVSVSAGEVAESLYHDALFGHQPGAFTGANRPKDGSFELAKNGTLFLDDLAYFPKIAQSAVLRVLEDRRFLPLGAVKDRPITCRELFATTKSLVDLERDGQLLPDLRSRMGELIIRVPSLAERPEEIIPIADHLARGFLKEHAYGQTRFEISAAAAELMIRYPWPTNIRELKGVVERAILHAGPGKNGIVILPDHLPGRFLKEWSFSREDSSNRLSRDLVRQIVRDVGGNRAEAARQLGVHRNTVARYLKGA